MKHKRILALLLAAFLSVGTLTASGISVPAEGTGATLSTDNMSLAWDESGTLRSVILQGKECIADSPSGFRISDAANGSEYTFTSPLTGGREKTQSGIVDGADLQMEVAYRQEGHAIYVNGTLTDTSGTDRLIRMEYRLPVSSQGMYWYDDISTKMPVKINGDYSMPAQYYPGGHKMSLYPFGTVSNGEQAVAFGVPMELPQSFLIGYKNADGLQAMTVRFDFALTDKTPKTFSKADFSFVIYAPSLPEWGFRSAAQDYYDLFPEYFEVKSHGGGNWLFQHAYDDLEGLEDFYFGYNETPGSYLFDEQNGVASFVYTAPAEQWMEWPGMPKEPEPTYEQYLGRFNDLLNDTSGVMEPGFPSVTQQHAAEAMKNSAVLLANGRYFTVGWYAYGVSVCFITNHNPDIPGWNSYKLQISNVERGEENALAEGARLDGVYIDNLAGLGSYNYREDHFPYVDMPLLWDVSSQRLVIPAYSSMYSYTKAIRDRCDENDQLLMANMVFPERGIAQYVHMVDVPGSECGPDWGWEPYVQRLRRTMAYRKPWLLLMGHATGNSGNWGASVASYEDRENIMKSSIAYGLFANVIGYRVPLSEYEAARPLFRKYAYIAVMQDKLGWNPVTYAALSGTGFADCERFGDLGTGAAIFTAYNTGERKTDFEGQMQIDLNAMKVSSARAKKLLAYDLVNNEFLPIRVENGTLSYDLKLKQLDLSAVMIGTREEIFAWEFEKIKTTLQRGDRTAEKINGELAEAGIAPSAGWTELSEALSKVSAFKDMDAAQAMKQVSSLVAGVKATADAADGAISAMSNYEELLNIDVKNIYCDAYGVLYGLTTVVGDADGDGSVTSTDARLTLQFAVNKIGEEDVLNPVLLDVDGDGSVTSTDARLILQYAVGKIGPDELKPNLPDRPTIPGVPDEPEPQKLDNYSQLGTPFYLEDVEQASKIIADAVSIEGTCLNWPFPGGEQYVSILKDSDRVINGSKSILVSAKNEGDGAWLTLNSGKAGMPDLGFEKGKTYVASFVLDVTGLEEGEDSYLEFVLRTWSYADKWVVVRLRKDGSGGLTYELDPDYTPQDVTALAIRKLGENRFAVAFRFKRVNSSTSNYLWWRVWPGSEFVFDDLALYESDGDPVLALYKPEEEIPG